MKQATIKEIAQEYREGLKTLLGENILQVIIYGSQARGDAVEGSDIDLLCIIRSPFDYSEMIRKTSELTSSLSLKYDISLSRVFASQADFENRQLPFFMNVRREGVPA